ncbi:hypothetical protein FPE01S_03_00200 [Flavihumibacter petaseus NBRC 106054]|uniref:Porin n=1 Tax=Flavihumibacter petaseus NBRC 106054 TaxID=1220578 RepID=A0A0E9N2U8_9BACT|nr:hypothetical protein FPE01S_03_00200 [Flavihumibacter petaseus NBRC 106054]
MYAFLALLLPATAFSQNGDDEKKTSIEVQGFIMSDMGYNFNSIDPDWFDVMRPTKLPSRKGEFGTSGNIWFSVRQTRFGISSNTPTKLGELKTLFNFDLMGFGVNKGQTTFHLINAWAQLGKFLIGQTASIFMDQDVFPVTLDYWGPMSRLYNFNIQVRYIPISNEKRRLYLAIERPGATADEGNDATSIALDKVKPYYRMPNLLAQYRQNFSWGYVQAAVLAKLMQWDDVSGNTATDLSGKAFGWGWTLSSVVPLGQRFRFKVQVVQGEGSESHIADAPADVVPEHNPSDPVQYIKGIPQPVWGFFTYLDMDWNSHWASSAGYSQETVSNGNLQAPDAFRKGQYASVNLRFMPWTNIMAGIEYQYGKRHNYQSAYSASASKLQFSVKVNFSAKTSL